MDVRRVQELTRELEQLSRVAQSIQNRYQAHFSLHIAACLDRDKDAALEHRQALHVILDRLLDNGEAIQKRTDELIALSRTL